MSLDSVSSQQSAPAYRPTSTVQAIGSRWGVAAGHALAAEAAAHVLGAGGNAIDAGVAAGIALNVLERHLTDFGGVAPIIVYRPGMAAPETIDGLGRWPASLDLETYRRRHGDVA